MSLFLEKVSEKIKTYAPLLIIIGIICALTLAMQIARGFNLEAMMYDFMAFTFLIFGGVKMLNWRGFIDAFRSYDDVAKRFYWYAALYPLFEIGLGIAYWFRWAPVFTNIVTILLTFASTISVIKELRKDRPFPCACLGAVFVLPMTWVTLFENLFMMIMAFMLLIKAF